MEITSSPFKELCVTTPINICEEGTVIVGNCTHCLILCTTMNNIDMCRITLQHCTNIWYCLVWFILRRTLVPKREAVQKRLHSPNKNCIFFNLLVCRMEIQKVTKYAYVYGTFIMSQTEPKFISRMPPPYDKFLAKCKYY